MPRGGARPGAGRPRKPLAHHMLTGGYRADRHGPPPSNVVALPAPAADWRPAKSDVDGLGPRARGWLATTLGLYRLDELEGAQVLLAVRALDRVDALERAVADGGGAGVADRGLLVAIDRATRTFAGLWAGLRLGGKD